MSPSHVRQTIWQVGVGCVNIADWLSVDGALRVCGGRLEKNG